MHGLYGGNCDFLSIVCQDYFEKHNNKTIKRHKWAIDIDSAKWQCLSNLDSHSVGYKVSRSLFFIYLEKIIEFYDQLSSLCLLLCSLSIFAFLMFFLLMTRMTTTATRMIAANTPITIPAISPPLRTSEDY